MRAVVMRAFGGPEVLKLEDVPTPVAGPGEVGIEVHAVSINRSFDLLVRRDGNNRGVSPPLVLGTDPSGVVREVGAGVAGFAVGDRVAVAGSIRCGRCRECLAGDESACRNTIQVGVHRWGGYAERVVVPATNAHHIPDGLGFAEATVVLRHGPAAFNQLGDKAELKPGEWVLVMGAAGGLGSCCVQVAKHLGARVIAAAGAESRVRAALALGADFGVDYRASDLAAEVMRITDGAGADVVCENIGDPTLWAGAFDSLAQRGRLVTMGAHGGGKVELDIRKLYSRRLRVIGAAGITARNIKDAFDAAAAGKLEALIDSVLPLEAATEAHRRLEEDGDVIGKVILDPTLAA